MLRFIIYGRSRRCPITLGCTVSCVNYGMPYRIECFYKSVVIKYFDAEQVVQKLNFKRELGERPGYISSDKKKCYLV